MRNETDEAEEVFKDFAHFTNLQGNSTKGDAEKGEPSIFHESGGNISYYEIAKICIPDMGQPKAAFVGDNSATILRQKLCKSYTIDGPINLILYTSGIIITPKDDLTRNLKEIIQNTSENPYQEIYLLGEEIPNIIRLYP